MAMVAVFISGCIDWVATEYPISETSDIRDKQLLEGTWLSLDSEDILLMSYDKNGIIRMAIPGWDNKEQKFYISDEGEFISARIGNKRYLSLFDKVKDKDGKELVLYILALGEIEGDIFTICDSDEEQFKNAIKKRKLSGIIDDGGIHITANRDELANFLKNNEDIPLFDCDDAIKMKRIAKLNASNESDSTEEKFVDTQEVIAAEPE